MENQFVTPSPHSDLYLTEQVRELDRVAIEERGIPGLQLMGRAGSAIFELLSECWPDTVGPGQEMLHIFCGAGNNAGDGYIVAAMAAQQQWPVRVIQVGAPEKLTGDARQAFGRATAAGVELVPFNDCLDLAGGAVVDALLGSGLSGDVREPCAQAIRLINASQLPVLSVDLPSGLCGDTGAELGVAVQADATVSFIGLKQGLFTGRGPAWRGRYSLTDWMYPPISIRVLVLPCSY